MNIPNTLTMLRILLIPLFITAIIYERFHYALLLFIFAALTDLFDGLIARIKNQKTPIGAFLDPLADKFLLVTSFIILTVRGFIPKWLTITVISRDIIVVTGWVIIYLHTGSSKVEPSLLGKMSNTLQVITIASILISVNYEINLKYLSAIYIFTAISSVISCLHYMYRGLKDSINR